MTGRATAALALVLLAPCCRRAQPPRAMEGARYPPGRSFAVTYCAPCHTEGGAHPRRKDAHAAFAMDTFDEWQAAFGVLRGVLDPSHLDGKIMPPPDAPAQPSEAERRLVLEWVLRGSPNTADGRCPDGRVTCKPGF
jgi:mono/diheme cytochrome c family protein